MEEESELGRPFIVGVVSVATLALFICFVSLSRAAQIGPDVGDIVVFEARGAPRDWPLSTVLADNAPDAAVSGRDRACVLNPSAMGIAGGSLVVEAKETTEPPSFRVHWSGSHTDLGSQDCGTSVDLTMPLASLRVLANSAGGFNSNIWRNWF